MKALNNESIRDNENVQERKNETGMGKTTVMSHEFDIMTRDDSYDIHK